MLLNKCFKYFHKEKIKKMMLYENKIQKFLELIIIYYQILFFNYDSCF